ncbi:hypothetical protein Tco_1008105 [Tanacetum coccineum]
MGEPNDYITATRKKFVSNDNEGTMVEKCIVKIQGTFLVKIRDDTFNGNVGENAFKHIDKFLKIVRLIKINELTQDRFRLSIFPVSLAGAISELFTKECVGLITTWDNMVEKFILKFHHLSDHNEETEEDDNPNETYNVPELNNDKVKGTEEPWSENGVPYQVCDHTCEPYHFKNGGTRWPMCTSDIDGFCNGGELPGMVQVGSMTYFQDHRWYDELADGKLKGKTLALKDKWKVNAHEIAPFTRMENFRREPYVNMKTKWANNPYLDVNRVFRRDYEASNVSGTQENQGHEEQKGNLNPEPSNYKVRRFEMMKYSFDDDEEYITIKESEYLKHSKDSLDAYRELLRLINEGWVMTTPEDK